MKKTTKGKPSVMVKDLKAKKNPKGGIGAVLLPAVQKIPSALR